MKDPQRISKIKPFIDQHDWKKISFPSNKKDWQKFESSNKSVSLNVLYISHNREKNKVYIYFKA